MESFMPKRSLCRYLHPALQEIPDSNLLAPPNKKSEFSFTFSVIGISLNGKYQLVTVAQWVMRQTKRAWHPLHQNVIYEMFSTTVNKNCDFGMWWIGRFSGKMMGVDVCRYRVESSLSLSRFTWFKKLALLILLIQVLPFSWNQHWKNLGHLNTLKFAQTLWIKSTLLPQLTEVRELRTYSFSDILDIGKCMGIELTLQM